MRAVLQQAEKVLWRLSTTHCFFVHLGSCVFLAIPKARTIRARQVVAVVPLMPMLLSLLPLLPLLLVVDGAVALMC